jgi:hypothetical protein
VLVWPRHLLPPLTLAQARVVARPGQNEKNKRRTSMILHPHFSRRAIPFCRAIATPFELERVSGIASAQEISARSKDEDLS